MLCIGARVRAWRGVCLAQFGIKNRFIEVIRREEASALRPNVSSASVGNVSRHGRAPRGGKPPQKSGRASRVLHSSTERYAARHKSRCARATGATYSSSRTAASSWRRSSCKTPASSIGTPRVLSIYREKYLSQLAAVKTLASTMKRAMQPFEYRSVR